MIVDFGQPMKASETFLGRMLDFVAWFVHRVWIWRVVF